MTVTNFARVNKTYIIQVTEWGKRLGASDITIHSNKSVTLECKDGYICHNYFPTTKELIKG